MGVRIRHRADGKGKVKRGKWKGEGALSPNNFIKVNPRLCRGTPAV
jgi:hypothetical protein